MAALSGINCDCEVGDDIVLTNKITGQKVNHVLIQNRSTSFDRAQKFDEFDHLSCPSSGKNCQKMKDEIWTKD